MTSSERKTVVSIVTVAALFAVAVFVGSMHMRTDSPAFCNERNDRGGWVSSVFVTDSEGRGAIADVRRNAILVIKSNSSKLYDRMESRTTPASFWFSLGNGVVIEGSMFENECLVVDGKGVIAQRRLLREGAARDFYQLHGRVASSERVADLFETIRKLNNGPDKEWNVQH